MYVTPLLKRLLRRTGILFFIFLASSILPQIVTFPQRYDAGIATALHYIAVFALFFQAIIWVNALTAHWTDLYIERNKVNRLDATTIRAVAIVVRVTAGAILLLLAFEELGKNVTGLVTGLGISGIAIAFALQNILSDLFSAFSIVLDKPFVIGDAVQVDQLSGTVQRIGLKSTRILSDDGEEIVFSNSDILKSRLRNFGRMEERRAILATRVSGDTTPNILARIPVLLGEIIQAQPDVQFGRSHFKSIGDATIDFESVYYLKNTSYKVFMDTQQAIMLAVMQRLAEEKIELAVILEAAVKQKTAGRT
jgi:small-conductance mechanosensitive channel